MAPKGGMKSGFLNGGPAKKEENGADNGAEDNAEVKKLKDLNTMLLGKITEKTKEVKAKEDQVASLEKQVEALTASTEAATKRASDKTGSEDLTSKLKAAEDEAKHKDEQLQALKAALTKKEKELEVTKKVHQAQLSDKKGGDSSAVDAVKNELKELEKKFESSSSALKTMTKERDQHKANCEKQKSELASIKKEWESVSTGHEKAMAKLKENQDSKAAAMDAHKQTTAQLESSLKGFKDAQDSLQKKFDKQTAELVELKKDYNGLTSTDSLKGKQLAAVEKELKEVKKERDTLKNRKPEGAEASLKVAQLRVGTLEEDLKVAQTALKNVKDACKKEADAELEKMRERERETFDIKLSAYVNQLKVQQGVQARDRKTAEETVGGLKAQLEAAQAQVKAALEKGKTATQVKRVEAVKEKGSDADAALSAEVARLTKLLNEKARANANEVKQTEQRMRAEKDTSLKKKTEEIKKLQAAVKKAESSVKAAEAASEKKEASIRKEAKRQANKEAQATTLTAVQQRNHAFGGMAVLLLLWAISFYVYSSN